MIIKTPLKSFPGIAALMERVVISPPFLLERARPGDASVTDVLLTAVTGYPKNSVLVTGPIGIGKTTTLARAFKAAEPFG